MMFLPARIKLAIVATLAILALLAGAAAWLRHDARDELRTRIEERDTDAANTATDAALAFRRCRDLGGVYDFRTRDCGGLVQDGR